MKELRDRSYWDWHYEGELSNFDDHGDEGEIWFGKLLNHKIVEKLIKLNDTKPKFNIIDIGCGNSYLLIKFVTKIKVNQNSDHGITMARDCNIIGIDYSSKAIELSRRLAESSNFNECMEFKQCDFLNIEQVNQTTDGIKFDFIVDKGTYDAICLIESKSIDGLNQAKKSYMESIYSLVKSGTIFIFASCNNTEEELMELFKLECTNKIEASIVERIDTPTMQFGGKQGSQVTCLVIKFQSQQT